MLSEQWAALSGLTRSHAIVRVMACSLINNRNLVYGDGASRLLQSDDYYW
jgi:hypothetical protein